MSYCLVSYVCALNILPTFDLQAYFDPTVLLPILYHIMELTSRVDTVLPPYAVASLQKRDVNAAQTAVSAVPIAVRTKSTSGAGQNPPFRISIVRRVANP